MKKYLLIILIVSMAALILLSAPRISKRFPSDNEKVSQEKYGRIPLYFVEKKGSGYFVQGKDKSLYFTSNGLVFSLSGDGWPEENFLERAAKPPGAKRVGDKKFSEGTGPVSRWNVKVDFVGANSEVKPVGQDPTPAVISYFKGDRSSWKTGLKTYGSLLYKDLWPGIDLVYQGNGIKLQYEFFVHPGADPSQIKFFLSGAETLDLNPKGEIEVKTPLGNFTDERPYTYQKIDGEKREVESSYLLADSSYRFHIGSYDKTKELVIDPATIVYAGFIGGSDNDYAYAIAIDSSGNAYITGETSSTQTTFPVSGGPDLTQNGGRDAYVAKINSAGTALSYVGFIGGSATDYGADIAVDSSGNAYVTGVTSSSEATFPVVGGPDTTYNANTDAFVAKINSAGTALTYSGYIGGSGDDDGHSIALDSSGRAYITGSTSSSEASFPVAVGPTLAYGLFQNDAYVARVAANGLTLDYCGYIGGIGQDYGYGIAVDSSNGAYVTGTTASAAFPVTVGPDLTANGGDDAFIGKIKSDGTGFDYLGYIGGSGDEDGFAVAVDSSGNAYVMGNTTSTQADFPVSVGPDLTANGGRDIFITKVNSGGTALTYSGFIGGSGDESEGDVAVDGSGNAYVVGATTSTQTTFPVSGGPDLTQNGGAGDGFIAKVNSTGSALSYAGFIGGSGVTEGVNGIAVNSSGDAYVAGSTNSTESSFPVTVGPDLTQNGGLDVFVAKISIVAVCGDGVIEGSEACDDGNATNTDACPNTCVAASCGDGFVRSGVEACDDANSSNTDACLTTCVAASCGDGFIRSGVEECDAGGTSDTCSVTCQTVTATQTVQTSSGGDSGSSDSGSSSTTTVEGMPTFEAFYNGGCSLVK